MKIATIEKKSIEGVEENVVNVNGTKVFTITGIAVVLNAVITALTFFYVNLPNNKLQVEQDIRLEKLEILNTILRSTSDDTREKSLLFLSRSGLLDGIDKEAAEELVKDSIIPDWSKLDTFRKIDLTDRNSKFVETKLLTKDNNVISISILDTTKNAR